jgi:hypothetical protein
MTWQGTMQKRHSSAPLGRIAVRLLRIGLFPGFFGGLFCLLPALLVGCGDYCLFDCNGEGGGGGGGGSARTAEPGDVILAGQFVNTIFLYEFPAAQRRSLLSGYGNVSGLALYSNKAENTCDRPFSGLAEYQGGGAQLAVIDIFPQQVDEPDRLSLAVIPKGMTFSYGTDPSDPDPGTTTLLFFTVDTQNRLYLYDITGTTVPDGFENPYPITNQDLLPLFGSSDFFASPTDLAVHVSQNTAALFVLNDNGASSSVRRLSINLSTWLPNSPRTIATMTEPGWRLVDMAYYAQGDKLFVSMKSEGQDLLGGRVFSIPNATTRTSPVTLTSEFASAFIAQDYEITGLAVAPTDDQPGPADLLSLRSNQLGQVEQFDINLGGNPVAQFSVSFAFEFPQALAYDCTHRRLLMTDVPANNDLERTFFQAAPVP